MGGASWASCAAPSCSGRTAKCAEHGAASRFPGTRRRYWPNSRSHRRDRQLAHRAFEHAACGAPILPPQGKDSMTKGKRIFVLDTNVLMHDPTALFRFEEHDVFLPMTVLEELDAAKKGTSEASRNARQVSRFINELIERNRKQPIANGLELKLPQGLQ